MVGRKQHYADLKLLPDALRNRLLALEERAPGSLIRLVAWVNQMKRARKSDAEIAEAIDAALSALRPPETAARAVSDSEN